MGKTRRRGDRSDGSDVGAEQKLYLHEPLLELRVPEPDLIFLTDLPGGLDHDEWVASHTIGFFEHINLLYGTVSEFCTQSSCPDMMGPGPRQYLWVDDKGKKSRVSAPQYIDYIMTFVQKTINDETVFPTKHGQDFPAGFDSHIRKIHRLLFHVLAHIYHAHFKEIVLLHLHAHLNALFAHFVEFNLRFQTVEDKEIEVLDDLIVALRLVPPRENPETPPPGDQDAGDIADPAGDDCSAAANNKESIADDQSAADAMHMAAESVPPIGDDSVGGPVICSQPKQTSEFPPLEANGGGDSSMTVPDVAGDNCVEMSSSPSPQQESETMSERL